MIYSNHFDLIETTSCNYPRLVIGERNIEILAKNIYVIPPHPLFSSKTVNVYQSMSMIDCCKMRFINVISSEREMNEIIANREVVHNNKIIKKPVWATAYVINDGDFKSSPSSTNLYEFGGCIEGSIAFRHPNAYLSDVSWKIEAESFELEIDDELVKYLLGDTTAKKVT